MLLQEVVANGIGTHTCLVRLQSPSPGWTCSYRFWDTSESLRSINLAGMPRQFTLDANQDSGDYLLSTLCLPSISTRHRGAASIFNFEV